MNIPTIFRGESGSDITLEFFRKDITKAQKIESIEICRDTKLKSFTSFMIGFPGETDRELFKTLDIYDDIILIDPEGARINRLFVYMGRKQYDIF